MFTKKQTRQQEVVTGCMCLIGLVFVVLALFDLYYVIFRNATLNPIATFLGAAGLSFNFSFSKYLFQKYVQGKDI